MSAPHPPARTSRTVATVCGPITPVVLTAIPMHQRGAQALRSPEESR